MKVKNNSSAVAPNIVNISIEATDFDNLQFISEDEDEKFKLSIKFVDKIIESKVHCKSGEKEIFTATDEQLKVISSIPVNVNDQDEIFNISTYPLLLTLFKINSDGTHITLGHTNIDLSCIATCSSEKRIFQKYFEREDAHGSFFRKISCNIIIQSDGELLSENFCNSLSITIQSINNLDAPEEIQFGVKIPCDTEFSKGVKFAVNTSLKSSKFRKWFNMLEVSGGGGKTNIISDSNEYPLTCEENVFLQSKESECKINALLKVMLSNTSNNTFHDHLRKSYKIAIEVFFNNEHYVGFIDAEELTHVDRKKVQKIVPLVKFSAQTFRENCNYECVLQDANKIQNKKKSASKRKTADSTRESNESSMEIIYAKNKSNKQIFVDVEMELDKALNEEIFMEPHGIDFENAKESADEREINKFMDNLKLTVRDWLRKYKDAANENEVILNAIGNGDFALIEEKFLPEILNLEKKFQTSEESENASIVKLMSHILNQNLKLSPSEGKNLILAKIYDALNMHDEANEIFLTDIVRNKNEDSWLNYSIYNLRILNFDKAFVCIDEVLKMSETSVLGNILKSYVYFKTHKYTDSLRLLNFIEHKHGKVLEVSIMRSLVAQFHTTAAENIDFNADNFQAMNCIQNVYNSEEVLWHAINNNESCLNWNNNFVKCAIFFAKIGCYEFAELSLAEYYKTHGVNFNYLYILAAIDSMQHNYKNALIHFRKISRGDVGSHQLYYSKIEKSIYVNLLLKDPLPKLEVIFEMGSSGMDNFLPYFVAGLQLIKLNKYEEAKCHLIQAVKIFPCDKAFCELGKVLEHMGEDTLAEECYLQAVKMRPNSKNNWSNLCDIYCKLSRTDILNLCTDIVATLKS